MPFSSEQILNSIPLGVIITDLGGQIVGANSALCSLLGYAEADLLGNTLSMISADQDSGPGQNALAELTAGRPHSPYIEELATRSGESLAAELHPSVILDKGGKPANALFVVKPLSEEMKLLKSLQRRNMHMLASSEVSRAATQILEAQDLLTRCVDLIRKHFGFYYAAIFLIDDAGEWAVLRAATGEAGQELLKKAHKLGVGSQSMVGWVTANNAARIALDVGQEAVRFDNPLLPKTRSEIALPLRVRGEVIGALDAQSTGLNAFSEDDIQTIQMMADQVAIAIDNARLFSGRGS